MLMFIIITWEPTSTDINPTPMPNRHAPNGGGRYIANRRAHHQSRTLDCLSPMMYLAPFIIAPIAGQ